MPSWPGTHAPGGGLGDGVGAGGARGVVNKVVVKAVDSASSLSETEMQPGDVILKLNDMPTPNVVAFRKAAAQLRPGDIVRIVWQGKRYPDTIKRLTIVTID